MLASKLVQTKPRFFVVMSTPPPPVIDYARQSRLAEIVEKSPFNMFNIVALIVIIIAGFFLYKRYKDKQAVERAHMLRPSPVIKTPDSAPIVTPPQVEEVKAD